MKIAVFALVALSLASSPARAAVMRLVVVQSPDPRAYVKALAKGQALMKASGSPAQIRVWKARFAGPEAGTVVVAVEYPDLAAIAADDPKLLANSEYQAWIKGLDELRKIVSDSLYEEVKP